MDLCGLPPDRDSCSDEASLKLENRLRPRLSSNQNTAEMDGPQVLASIPATSK